MEAVSVVVLLNAMAAGAAVTVWLIAALRRSRGGSKCIAALYLVGSVSASVVVAGYVYLMLNDAPPRTMAWGARSALAPALLCPAVARLLEMLLEDRRREYRVTAVRNVERRAARHAVLRGTLVE